MIEGDTMSSDRDVWAEVCEAHEADDRGIITSPGKFEGEPLWVAFFWELALLGFEADYEMMADGTAVSIFSVTQGDHEILKSFPSPSEADRIRLYETGDGFVHCDTVKDTPRGEIITPRGSRNIR
jgi:hypothetical protein